MHATQAHKDKDQMHVIQEKSIHKEKEHTSEQELLQNQEQGPGKDSRNMRQLQGAGTGQPKYNNFEF